MLVYCHGVECVTPERRDKMARELKFNDYYRAAKMVANCPRDRVSAVLKILEQSGVNVETLEEIIKSAEVENTHHHIYYKRRNNGKRGNWLDTDNEIALMLRKAYDYNVGFTTLSNLCGLHRSILYHYMRGIRVPSPENAQVIKDTLTKIFEDIGV